MTSRSVGMKKKKKSSYHSASSASSASSADATARGAAPSLAGNRDLNHSSPICEEHDKQQNNLSLSTAMPTTPPSSSNPSSSSCSNTSSSCSSSSSSSSSSSCSSSICSSRHPKAPPAGVAAPPPPPDADSTTHHPTTMMEQAIVSAVTPPVAEESSSEEDEISEVDSFLLEDPDVETEDEDEGHSQLEMEDEEDDDDEEDDEESILSGSPSSLIVSHPPNATTTNTTSTAATTTTSVDPETQARLEALLEAAGIGKLSGEAKQLTDPEVLKRLTSSVSCALDEAAAALTRMRSDPPADGRSLVEACNEGDIGKVRKLLDEGRVSVNDPTEQGESLLSLACSAGYFELAQVLLAMGANVEDRGMKNECTPLMEASTAGHVDIINRLLLPHGADVNAQSSSGNTPLMYACAGGHEDVVLTLLEGGANVEDHNENGHTPLMEAASAGHVGVAKILLKYGAGINTHSNEFKESALTLACYKGHLEMVRFLLDAGADQEHKTDEMHTALMEASMDGHVQVARLLLDSGAQVNMPADSFESPLTLAACGGHVELAMLLLERGANIEEVNDEGYTPLMEASREGHEEMVALLLSQGADINAQTEETQETALTLACCGGFLDVADFLIKAGADIELGASTPLMEAAQEGHLELVRHLLENSALVNAQTGTGDTALTYTCENGHTDVADLLLSYNAELEHESEGGRTPLMKASRAGHLCTVQFLISKGADINRPTTNNDHTPLSLACAGGHLAVVELLLQAGADPYHKLRDNSTMIIEAAKGGYTSVVQLLIDFPNSIVLTPNSETSNNEVMDRVPPADGSHLVAPPNSNHVVIPPSSKPASSYKSVLRKNQRGNANATTTANNNNNGKGPNILMESPPNSDVTVSNNGYDFLEGSTNLVLEGLEDKGLDAKSYIHSMLRRSDGSTMEEKLIQKEHILAELQRVEKELQEKAQAQLLLSSPPPSTTSSSVVTTNSGGREAGEGCSSPHMTALEHHSIHHHQMMNSNAAAASIISAPSTGVPPLSTRALASLPPSERPKAKPSRKNNSDASKGGVSSGGKKSQLQAAVLQHTQQLAQLQQLQQLNHQLQQQVHQQKQLKQQNQATLANLQQNAILNQQQLASLQANVAQLQQMEQQILTQQQAAPSVVSASNNNNNNSRDQQLQQKIQHILHEKHQLQQQIKQFQLQVEQQLAYTQHASPAATVAVQDDTDVTAADVPTTATTTYEYVRAPHALRAVQAATMPLPMTSNNSSTDEPVVSTASDPSDHQIKYSGGADHQIVSSFGQQLIFQTSQILEGPLNFSTSDLNFGSTYTGGTTSEEEMFNTTSNTTTSNNGAMNELLPGVVSPPRGSVVDTFSNSKKVSSKNIKKCDSPSSTNNDSLVPCPSDTGVPSRDIPATGLPVLGATSSSTNTNNNNNTPTANPPMIDIDSATESNHDTALTLACAGGHEDLVKLLLSRGANIEHRDKKGFTPLILAATAGHEKVVEILLDHTVSAEIEAQSDRTKDTPLSLACSGGRYEVVEILLSRHANREHRNVSDYTPLSLAASGGYVNIIKLLLSHGAEINSRTGSKLGISPLMLAAMNGHTAAVKLLLDMGSDINAQIETNRNTALTLACFQGRHEVVSLLLDRKAAVEHRAKTGLTPLMEAASGGYVDVGRVLLDKGADVNAPPVPSSRDTALTIAADKGHYRFVELLLSRGAQVDVRNKKGNSSLWLASNGGHLDVVQLLHSAGANIDSQDNRKVSCLMAAFRKGHSKVVKWMVKHVSQFPSDLELTRFMTTINDRDLMRKCRQCWDIIRVAKDRQAAEAAKNATNLLEELDRESKLEQSKKEAAARKREKKKRKKLEKAGKVSNKEEEVLMVQDDEDKENEQQEGHPEDDEKPEIEEPEVAVSQPEVVIAVESEVVVQSNATIMEYSNNNNTLKMDCPKKSKKGGKKKKDLVIHNSSDVLQKPDEDFPPEEQPSSLFTKAKSRTNNITQSKKDSMNKKQPITTNNNSAANSVLLLPSTNPSSAGTTTTPKEDATGWKEVIRKSKKVSVPSNAISRVIGRGGSNINAIRELSGAYIEVEKLAASNKSCADRAILIKGSVEATRQANAWIQAIINCPEKDLAEIIGKQYKNLSNSGVVVSSSCSKNAVTPTVPIVSTSSSPVITKPRSTAVTSSGGKKDILTVSPSHHMKKTASNNVNKSSASSSSFAAVAMGNNPVAATLPTRIAPSTKPPLTNTTSNSVIPPIGSTGGMIQTPLLEPEKQQPLFSFTPFCSWGYSATAPSTEPQTTTTITTTTTTPNTNYGDLLLNKQIEMSKAPGYRGSPTPIIVNSKVVLPSATTTWKNPPKETRCSSAPETPISHHQMSSNSCNSSSSSSSTTGSTVIAPIGPPVSGTTTNKGMRKPTQPNSRSMTPEMDIDIGGLSTTTTRNNPVTNSNGLHHYLKIDPTTGLPQENLLNAAAQLAFLTTNNSSAAGNTTTITTTSSIRGIPMPFPSYRLSANANANNFVNPSSKLNPNAPDFTRSDYHQLHHLRGPPPTLRNQPRMANANLSNILSNQSINSFLHSMNQQPELDSATASLLLGGGHSLMEISDILSRNRNDATGMFNAAGPATSSVSTTTSSSKLFSRPIGSERNKNKPPLVSPHPWDLSSIYADSPAASAGATPPAFVGNSFVDLSAKEAPQFNGGIDPPGFVSRMNFGADFMGVKKVVPPQGPPPPSFLDRHESTTSQIRRNVSQQQPMWSKNWED